MANNYSLKEVGVNNRTIGDYIITDNPQVIINSDKEGAGNIIIYVSDGSNTSSPNLEDYENNEEKKYHDLYIGDEHIAGGFGLPDIKTRNIIVALPEEVDKIVEQLDKAKEDIEKIKETFNIDDEIRYPNLEVIEEFNTIETSFGLYTLTYDQGQIRIINDVKPTLHDIEITFVDGSVMKQGETYPHDIFENFGIKKISFVYEGSYDIKSFYLSYFKPGLEYDNVYVGEYNKPVDIDFTRTNFDDITGGKYISNISTKYYLSNPNRNPNVIQRYIEINFNEYNNVISSLNLEENHYLFKIAVLDKKSKPRKSLYNIGEVFIAPPIYYGTCKDIPNNEDLAIFAKKLIADFDTIEDINFKHGDIEEISAWIYIPQYLFGSRVSEHPTIWYNEDIVVKTKWDQYQYNLDFGNDIYYQLFKSPNKYKGSVDWKIKLEKN